LQKMPKMLIYDVQDTLCDMAKNGCKYIFVLMYQYK